MIQVLDLKWFKGKVKEQSAMLMKHLLENGYGYTDAYITLQKSETLKVLKMPSTEVFDRSIIALCTLLDTELSGDMDAWFREAFL